MTPDAPEPVIRVAGADDVHAVAELRALSAAAADRDPGFAERMAAWIAAEGERRTTWLAVELDRPIGMASLFEYRRMPRPGKADSRWGYVGNMFVREDRRNRGIGAVLMAAIIAAAEERSYARLVVSPSAASVTFYRRAGFVAPGETSGAAALLVRPGTPTRPGRGR